MAKLVEAQHKIDKLGENNRVLILELEVASLLVTGGVLQPTLAA
jgi:hypothetical protein